MFIIDFRERKGMGGREGEMQREGGKEGDKEREREIETAI